MKTWIIALLVAVIAIGGALGAFAACQTVETTGTVAGGSGCVNGGSLVQGPPSVR